MSFKIRKAVLSDLNAALQLDREAFGVDAWTFLDYMGVFSIRSVKMDNSPVLPPWSLTTEKGPPV